MRLGEILILEESKIKKSKDFWVDELGDMKIDFNNLKDVTDYIKDKADELNKKYKDKIDGRDIRTLTPAEVIKKIGWCLISLIGEDLSEKITDDKGEELPVGYRIYKKAIIRHPRENCKSKDRYVGEMVDRIKSLYSTVEEIVSIDRNGTVKNFTLPIKIKKRTYNVR